VGEEQFICFDRGVLDRNDYYAVKVIPPKDDLGVRGAPNVEPVGFNISLSLTFRNFFTKKGLKEIISLIYI